MSANEHCRHRSMHCACCPEAPVAPPPVGAMLAPAIRRALHKYSSVKSVTFSDDPWSQELVVTYLLIDGSFTVRRVPFRWYGNEQYSKILDHVTKELGGQIPDRWKEGF